MTRIETKQGNCVQLFIGESFDGKRHGHGYSVRYNKETHEGVIIEGWWFNDNPIKGRISE